MSEMGLRAVSVLGFAAMVGVAWLCSSDRRRIAWRTVGWGVVIQLALGGLLLRTRVGSAFFGAVNEAVARLLAYSDAGARFVFGALADTGFSFVVNVLPIIVFMGSFFAILYHLGIMQRIVDALAMGLSRSMRLSGAESLAAVANVFMGMVESALVVRPYLEAMTRSELFALMTLGMSTVAGSVLLAYVGMLGGAEYAGHLVTASLLSAPAGLLIAKIMIPETEEPETAQGGHAQVERPDVTVMGVLSGLEMACWSRSWRSSPC